MNGLYIADIDCVKYPHFIGVSNKIKGQLKAFSQLNVQMDYIYSNDGNIMMNDMKKYKPNLKIDMGFGYVFFKYILNSQQKLLSKYDFVYIRHSFANIYMYFLIKYLKSINVKVFVEIPTYPYHDQLKNNVKYTILKVVDNLILKSLKKYVYRLVMTNDMDYLFGAKTVKISNGIDLECLPLNNLKNDTTINIIAIANLSPWHGYDRIIRGLYEYYKDEPKDIVNFYVVGDGEEKNNLINLVDELDLNSKVCFLGVKHGKELDEVFNNMNIGASSLALFRAGGGHDPIKSKEYVGRGLPVLLGYKDRALDNSLPFVLQVPEDESYVDIDKLVKEYKNINISSQQIRKYAEENLSWKSQMKKIIDDLNDNIGF